MRASVRGSAQGLRKVTGDWRLATGDWRLATGDGDWRLWRLATGDWRLATGDWRLAMSGEVSGMRCEVLYA